MPVSLGLRAGQRSPIVVAGWIASLALLVVGCELGDEPQAAAERREAPRTATEVLDRVVEAYHHADRYQDAGRLLVRYTRDGESVNETQEFSLALAAPNRLRMRAYDALVVCDGQTLRATIDEAPGEVLSVPAPEELSPASIDKDPVLAKALNQIVGCVPLWLFLEPKPLPALLANGQSPQLDSPAKIGVDNCYRVRVERREGALVLWIDEGTFVVRRVEYPTDGYRQLIEPYVGVISDMTITAELEGARLDPPIDDATFEFDTPSDAELVKRFDSVHPRTRIPKFKLRALDGQQITRSSLAGKIAVLKFWRKDDVITHYRDLAAFEQVLRQRRDPNAFVFLAVSVDLDDVSDADLQMALAKAELSLPIARVSRQVAIRSFGLHSVPATVILGRDGTLQDLVLGPYPNQATGLSKKLDTLLAGGDLTLEAPQESRESLFYSGFAWQTTPRPEDEPPPVAAPPLPKVAIVPASEPAALRRKRLWRCGELRQPGNLLTVREHSGHDRAFVVEGFPSVAELGAGGKILATRRLDLPDRDDALVTFLRTAVDGAGRRYFLGAKPGAQQLHLFDESWKRLISFPESGDHPGITDALLADLNGDGELEMVVGYLQEVGVHCVKLDGQRLWRNRAAENVFRLAVTEPDRLGQRQVLVAQGLVLPIDPTGHERPPIGLPDAFVRLIYAADLDGDHNAEWLAIAFKWLGPGEPVLNIAVGLSRRGQELWRYPLPEGTHQDAAFDMVSAGALLGGEIGQWVIAGPDGSIHILGADGSAIDRFNFGAAPSGMTIANLDGQPALLLATHEAVEAWQFELPPGDPDQQPAGDPAQQPAGDPAQQPAGDPVQPPLGEPTAPSPGDSSR